MRPERKVMEDEPEKKRARKFSEPTRVASGHDLRLALALTIGLRLFYSVCAFFAVPYLKLDPVLVRSNDFSDIVLKRSDGLIYNLIGVWQRFDTMWYVHIAQSGYDKPASVVFYPLYPVAIRLLTYIVGNPYVAALAISTVGSFFLFLGLKRLLELDLSSHAACRAVLLCAFWPASFIFFAAYPESLLTALIVWSIYQARRQRWWVAALLGCLAALTKAVGALVFVPLLIVAIRDRRRSAWPILLTAITPLLWSLTMAGLRHIPSARAYSLYWRTEVDYPWATLWRAIARPEALTTMNLLFVVIAVIFSLRPLVRLEYAAFSIAAATLFLTKSTHPLLQSSMRYVLAIFPAFAGLAQLRNRLFFVLLLIAAFLLNLKLFFAFLDWQLVV